MKYSSYINSVNKISSACNFQEYSTGISIKVYNSTNKEMLKIFRQGISCDTFVISCFSGFIDREDISILCRLPSDIILFNCHIDYLRYLELGKEINFPTDNGYCFGYSQLIGISCVPVAQQKDIIFFEQVIVPTTFSERCYLLRKLVKLANIFPDKKVWIKPRCKPGGRTIHKQKWHLERLRKLLRIKFPDNLCFTYEPVEQLLSRTALCLTISSTVAIEALARGIPTVIISDFGVRRDIHTASFVGSGCLATIDQIIAGYRPKPNQEWLNDYVNVPDIEAFKIRLNELLLQKSNGLLPSRKYPEGAFSLAPSLKPLMVKKMQKLFVDPRGFFDDSKFTFLKRIGELVFKQGSY